MRFNLNHNVRVKLTERGLSIMKARHDELLQRAPALGEFKPPKTDEEEWATFQLWSLMQEFGEYIAMGVPVPFETEIDIVEPADS